MPGFDAPLDLAQVASGRTPGAGRNLVYFKSDNRLYTTDTTGQEMLVGQNAMTLAPVRASSLFANITQSGLYTLDGVGLAAGDRVLCRGQTGGLTNGIWIAQAGAWTRATDANTAAKLPRGVQVMVLEGTNDRGKVFAQLNVITTLGTDQNNWRVATIVDTAGSLQYPPAGAVEGSLFWDRNAKSMAGWSGIGWERLNGVRICTSTTRPAFTGDDAMIYETDTKNAYIQQGGNWVPFGTTVVEKDNATPREVNKIDFTGAGVSVAAGTAGEAVVTITGSAPSPAETAMVGQIALWGGATAPEGWLLCDGSQVSRVVYATLASALWDGTNYRYGNGDGINTFNLPNMQNRFALGAGPNAPGVVAGSAAHVHNVTDHSHGVPDHVHAVNTGNNTVIGSIPGGGGRNAADTGHTHGYTAYAGLTGTYGMSAGVNSGGPSDGYPPFVALWYIIRAFPTPAPVPTGGVVAGAPLWAKEAVRACTTANINLASPGTAVFDNVTLVIDDRLLVTGQTTQSQNGIYLFKGTATPMVRATDADSAAKIAGAETMISGGTLYGGMRWGTAFKSTDTVGTNAMVWFRSMTTGEGTATGGSFTATHGTAVPTATQGTAIMTTAGKLSGFCQVGGWNPSNAGITVEVYFDGVLRGTCRLATTHVTSSHTMMSPVGWEQTVTAGTHYLYLRLTAGITDLDYGGYQITVMPQALAVTGNPAPNPVDSGWVGLPTLQNGWVQYPSWEVMAYRKINGIVYMKGLLAPGTTTAGTLMFTLPSGFRNSGPSHTPVATGATTGGALNIYNDGRVLTNYGCTGWVSLNNINYPADN